VLTRSQVLTRLLVTILLGIVLQFLVMGCAKQEILEAYKTPGVTAAVQLLEVSAYLDALTEGYYQVWKQGKLKGADLVLALRADNDARVAWDAYVAAVQAKKGTTEQYYAASKLVNTFAAIVAKWLPDILKSKPKVLSSWGVKDEAFTQSSGQEKGGYRAVSVCDHQLDNAYLRLGEQGAAVCGQGQRNLHQVS